MFYIPLWSAWVFNKIIFGKVISYMKKNFKNNAGMKRITRMKYFPCVLFVSFIMGTFDYLLNLLGFYSEVMSFLHYFTQASMGLLTTLVYVTDKQIFTEIR